MSFLVIYVKRSRSHYKTSIASHMLLQYYYVIGFLGRSRSIYLLSTVFLKPSSRHRYEWTDKRKNQLIGRTSNLTGIQFWLNKPAYQINSQVITVFLESCTQHLYERTDKFELLKLCSRKTVLVVYKNRRADRDMQRHRKHRCQN